jgi:dihydroneopterin aldolase
VSAGTPPSDRILVRGLRLWAHVGVLEQERLLGQWFELDLSRAITALQRLAGDLRCLTLEHFAERIFETLEQLYGPVPMALELRKCQAPVPGFSGIVAVQRSRHGG